MTTNLKEKYQNSTLKSILDIVMFILFLFLLFLTFYYFFNKTNLHDEIPNERYKILNSILKDNKDTHEIATFLHYYTDEKIKFWEYRSMIYDLNYIDKDKHVIMMMGDYDDTNNDFKNAFEALLNESRETFYNSEINLEHYNEITGLTVLSKDNLKIAKEYLSDGYISISEFNNFPEINQKITYNYIRTYKNTKNNEDKELEMKNKYIDNIILRSN